MGDTLGTGKCFFTEAWEDITTDATMDRVEVEPSLPNGLVFTDSEEYTLVDDLSGRLWMAPW